ncbi:MAG: type II toxin-antitoxin system VapC family toxin [Pseudomonadales bacterium]
MIVLDTHALVWWLSDKRRLSSVARREIDKQVGRGNRLIVSSISAWEIAMLVQKSRLTLTMDVFDWLAHVERLPQFRIVPVDNRIALRSTSLPEPFHKDPADRMIVATAQQLRAVIVTADRKLLDYPHVETIW